MSVGEAKARLLEFGHRPRGPKAAIRRDPVTAAAVAFFVGVVISRFRPGPLLPLGAVLSKPVLQRLVPLVGRLVAARVATQLHNKANGAASSQKQRPRRYSSEPFAPPVHPSPPRTPPPRTAPRATPPSGEWAVGPQKEGFSPPRARSRPPRGRQS